MRGIDLSYNAVIPQGTTKALEIKGFTIKGK
jgi:hypothetical protein